MGAVPGIKAKHAIITDRCRKVQGGDLEAFDEAARRLRLEYAELTRRFHPPGKGVQFHLVLTVEIPK